MDNQKNKKVRIPINTKINTIILIGMILLGYWFDSIEYSFAIGAFICVLLILIVEYSIIIFMFNPAFWNIIKWILFWIIGLTIIYGFLNM